MLNLTINATFGKTRVELGISNNCTDEFSTVLQSVCAGILANDFGEAINGV